MRAHLERMDGGKISTFSNGNQNHLMQQQTQSQQSPHNQLHSPHHMNNAAALVMQQSQSKLSNNFGQSMQQQQQQQQQLQIMIHPSESMPKLVGVDRLARRMNLYRQRHTDCGPRFDQSFSGACEQQTIETTVLQKRFLENKAKKVVKKTDKRQPDTILSNTVQSNVLMVSISIAFSLLFVFYSYHLYFLSISTATESTATITITATAKVFETSRRTH